MTAMPEQKSQAEYPGSTGFSVSDSRLVEETRRGDQSAFGDLVVRYERRLLRVILRIVSDRELARDLAQEAFLRAYERLDSFDTSRRFGPWLFRIAVNIAVDYLRKSRRRVRWTRLGEDTRAVVPDPRKTLDLQQEVRQVIDQLPEKYRIVLILRDLENFSTSEVAAILDREEATIRWRLAEAREKFHRLWTRRQDATTPAIKTSREEP
jgi:RNA polymerase sigma-70 factor (ECF subfamily)